ncbi:MAG: hypothetical protein DWQ04_28350 [Chloroflexi bacterium]|nr:MAG: hypothetical protein DWQ04_28350 [Chloroflexota bacterium]
MKFIPFHEEIKEALHEPGCAFCRMRDKTAFSFVDAILFELVNDPQSRILFNKARGYCDKHMGLLLLEGHAPGAAILMDGVMKTLLRILQKNPNAKSKPSQLNKLLQQVKLGNRESLKMLLTDLEPEIPCPVCTHIEDLENKYTHTLLKQFTGEYGLSEDFRQSDGLCLPHLRLVISHAGLGDNTRLLLEMQEAIWQNLEEELAEFIRKCDHNARDERISDIESISRMKAMTLIAGADLMPKKGK